MLTIYVKRDEIPVVDVSGFVGHIHPALVQEKDKFVSLRDSEPSQKHTAVEIVLMRRLFPKTPHLSRSLKEAILFFMEKYHAKQDLSVDCYAFANMVHGVEEHTVEFMEKYWQTSQLWFRPKIGAVIFFVKKENYFLHAAIHIGSGLCISVWGAGGDLEIASLKSMKKDFGADRILLAKPR